MFISHLLSLQKIAFFTFLNHGESGGRLNVIGLRQGLELIEKKKGRLCKLIFPTVFFPCFALCTFCCRLILASNYCL